MAALFNSQISAQNLDLILVALNGIQNDHTIVTSLVKFASDTQGIAATNSFFVATVLGRLRNPTATDEMMQLIADRHVALSLRNNLVDALCDTAHKSALPELQRLYADANTEQELKEEIAKTLYVLGDRTIPVDVDKILKDARGIGTFEQYIFDRMGASEQVRLLEDIRIDVGTRH